MNFNPLVETFFAHIGPPNLWDWIGADDRRGPLRFVKPRLRFKHPCHYHVFKLNVDTYKWLFSGFAICIFVLEQCSLAYSIVYGFRYQGCVHEKVLCLPAVHEPSLNVHKQLLFSK